MNDKIGDKVEKFNGFFYAEAGECLVNKLACLLEFCFSLHKYDDVIDNKLTSAKSTHDENKKRE